MGSFTMLALAVTPFGSAKAQTSPPECAQQMQACKEQVHNTRGVCLQDCETSADPQTCEKTAQDQFVAGVDTCNDLFQQCKAGLAPGGSYTLTCNNISVSDGTLSAVCTTIFGFPQNTSLANAYACPGDIANIDGTLTCEPVPCK
jgi:hypothetical protein